MVGRYVKTVPVRDFDFEHIEVTMEYVTRQHAGLNSCMLSEIMSQNMFTYSDGFDWARPLGHNTGVPAAKHLHGRK